MRQIFLTGEEAQKCPTLLRIMIANRATQSRILGFKCVEHRAQRNWSWDVELDFATYLRQRSQMLGKFDSNVHDSV